MNLLKTARTIVAAGAAIVTAATMTSSAQAQSLEELYKGKTVTIMLGHPPGGSYDLYSQLAAEFLGRHIPGNPEIIVQHRPGGGGRKGYAGDGWCQTACCGQRLVAADDWRLPTTAGCRLVADHCRLPATACCRLVASHC